MLVYALCRFGINELVRNAVNLDLKNCILIMDEAHNMEQEFR